MRLTPGRIAGIVSLALLAAAVLIPLPLYVESPSAPTSLPGCVRVERPAGPISGDYLLMTVNLHQATVVEALLAGLARDQVVIERQSVIPPGVDDRSFFDAQTQLFASTSDVATVVGLRAAGLDASLQGDGVAVLSVVPGSPAAESGLRHGDVITAVDGNKVRSDAELRRRIGRSEEGAPVTLAVTRQDQSIQFTLTPTRRAGRAVIGVEPQTVNPRAQLPFDVKVDAGRVGGPSAGLTIALAVYDAVAAVDLATGRRVAVTGTIDAAGRVGRVGGIALKGIAAARAKADVFLVPFSQVAEARSALPTDTPMEVIGVERFADAQRALRAAPPAAARVTPGPCTR